MKLPVSFNRNRIVLIILSFFLVAGIVLYAGIWHRASAKKNTNLQTERQLSPVEQSERELFEIINQQRKGSRSQSFDPDWNLFRVARIEAKRIASLNSEQPATISKMLNSLGYEGNDSQMFTVHTKKKAESVSELWRKSHQAESLGKIKAPRRIGTGYASGKNGRVWVVLLSTETSTRE
ncbi:hypothetical protein ABWW58_04300 [Sporolactobacillus sp. STCC-11]|uniref:hypothetical protein n=1 Tax=Sporolactobacillus caesalpiniae TaxID=3230362 RepID=UPI0033969490